MSPDPSVTVRAGELVPCLGPSRGGPTQRCRNKYGRVQPGTVVNVRIVSAEFQGPPSSIVLQCRNCQTYLEITVTPAVQAA